MGKKKKSNSFKWLDGYKDDNRKKKGKKSHQRTVKPSEPAYRRVKVSLDKGEAKENKKEVRRPVKVSKDFLERRNRCNHADGSISIDEYRRLSPAPEAYTPELKAMVDKFGEENVRVCARCYQVVVPREMVEADAVYDAVQILRASCGIAVANRRLTKKEIRGINELREKLAGFGEVIGILEELPPDDDRRRSDIDLNRNPGSTYVV